MWIDDKAKKHKKIERYVLVTVFLCFLAISGRYLYFSFISYNPSSIVSNMRDSILKKLNAKYLQSVRGNSEKMSGDFLLKRNNGGEWILTDKTGEVNKDYAIENNDEKISIRKIKNIKASGFYIDIGSVSDYFSRNNNIITDIPYSMTGDYFLVSEQEDLFPIFGYHNIVENEDEIKSPFLDIRKNDFIDQIQYYNNEMNCNWLTLGNVVENYILKKKKIPRNTCVMNFDDGRKNNFNIAFPILKENDIYATFFIIFSRLNQKDYMTGDEIGKLFRFGNEIGSHSISGGGMVNTDWFRSGEFAEDDLFYQIDGSKNEFNKYFYNVKIFAYPLGEWNDKVVSAIKESGYIAARDIGKDDRWRDRRALSTSMDNNFIWHLNYYKPELRYNEEIKKEVGYNGWWQFEEGNLILDDDNGNVQISQSIKPADQSYAVVSLMDFGDASENSFILERDGDYTIDMFVANNKFNENGFSVLIDDKNYKSAKDQSQECILSNNVSFCHYLVTASLSNGEHKIKVINKIGQTKLDRFRIHRSVPAKNEYEITIKEKNKR